MKIIMESYAAFRNDIGNIALGIMFIVLGVSGFAVLKINERKKDK